MTFVELLTEAIESLESTGCIFWACDGPDEPPVNMKTCRICGGIQDLRTILAQAQTLTAGVVERSHYYIIQRAHHTSEVMWVDSSGKYHGSTENKWTNLSVYNENTVQNATEDIIKAGVLSERDRLREIFGDDEVRVVRRDVTVTETLVE